MLLQFIDFIQYLDWIPLYLTSYCLQAIDGADGFQNTHLPQHYESAKFSVEQVIELHNLYNAACSSIFLRYRISCVCINVKCILFSELHNNMLAVSEMGVLYTIVFNYLMILVYHEKDAYESSTMILSTFLYSIMLILVYCIISIQCLSLDVLYR